MACPSFDTVYPADSLEFCPHPLAQDLLVCGTYKLVEDADTSPSKPQLRRGQCLVFSVRDNPDSQAPKSIQSIDFPAVPDMKWCHRSASCPALLGVADSEGHITLLQWDDEAGRLRSSDSVQCAAANVLCLSLDWSNRRFPDAEPGSLVVSLSDGNLALLQGASAGGLVVTETWHAHDHEPWVAAWDYWDPNRIYSGGDDLLWKCWDIRQGFARAAHTSRRFDSGVTSIQSHPHKEHIFAMGSYDSSVYLYDTRKAMTPVSKHDVGGGVWRVKWHPSPTRSNDLLTACMHDGFKVLRYDESGGMEIMKRFDEHESLAYGADWSFAGEDNSGETLIGTCSFYDHKMRLWRG